MHVKVVLRLSMTFVTVLQHWRIATIVICLFLIAHFVKVNFQKNGRWQMSSHCQKFIRQCQFGRTFGQSPSKVFECIVMQWVDDAIVSHVDPKQFGGLSGTSTTDALVEMTHKWYESTDSLN